jgi:predicted small integral membrane protein
MFRVLKSLLVLTIGVHALVYALQNVANIAQAQGAIAYIMSGADNQAYPNTMFFKTASPALAWFALVCILAGEISVAFFGIKGGWDLFKTRNGTAEQFNAAKSGGLWAAGLALLTWFGLFGVVGGAFFQMWQTEAGDNSLRGAFFFALASAITMLFVMLSPDE